MANKSHPNPSTVIAMSQKINSGNDALKSVNQGGAAASKTGTTPLGNLANSLPSLFASPAAPKTKKISKKDSGPGEQFSTADANYLADVAKKSKYRKCMAFLNSKIFRDQLEDAGIHPPTGFSENSSQIQIDTVYSQIMDVIHIEAKRKQVNMLFTGLLNGIETVATQVLALDTFTDMAKNATTFIDNPTEEVNWQPELEEIVAEMGDNMIKSPFARLAIKVAMFSYNYHQETMKYRYLNSASALPNYSQNQHLASRSVGPDLTGEKENKTFDELLKDNLQNQQKEKQRYL